MINRVSRLTQHGPAPDRVLVAGRARPAPPPGKRLLPGPARTARRQRRIRHRDPHLDRGHASGADGRANVVPETGLRQGARFLRRTTTQSSVTARPRPACGPAASGPRARRDHLARRLRPVKSVWRDGKIAGLIAWAPARPALFDVACALEHAAPFRDDEECARWLRYPRPPSRRCRIEVFHGACSIADPGERQCPRRPAAAHGRRHLRGPRPPRHRTAGHPGPRRPPGKSRAYIAWTEASGR